MSPATNVRWRILGVLVFASFISYVLRYNVSTAGPALMEDIGLSEIQFGWVLAAFTAGYTIFQFPGGLAVGAWGARRTLTTIMVLWGMMTLATSAIPEAGTAGTTTVVLALIFIRFFVGAIHAPIYPLTGGVVQRWFPVGSWALPNGLTSAGLTLGTAATASVLAWLMAQYGWRQSFAFLSPLAFIGAAIWWWYARDNPADHGSTNEHEVQLIHANRPAPALEVSEEPAWRRVLRNRDVLLLMASYFCTNYIFYLMFNWVFYYLVSIRNLADREAGFLTSNLWIAAALGAVLGGFACDHLCRRIGLRRGCRIPAMAGLIGSGIFLIGGALTANAYAAVALLAICFLFNQFAEAAFWAAGIGAGGRDAAAACGVMNTGGNAVGFVNALLVPFLASTYGWPVAISSGALFAFTGAVLWLFIRADNPVAA